MAKSLNKRDRLIRKIHEREMSGRTKDWSRRIPMKLVQREDGSLFLCDQDVVESEDLVSQGCMEYDRFTAIT